MSSISGLANDIFINELDSTGTSVAAISGWFESNLGQLNNVIYTSFSGVDGTVPGMGLEESSIYKEMYLYHHYTKATRNALRGIANDTNGNILSVRDGDNAITFVNKNEVSKVFKGLATDSSAKLGSLVANYNSFQSSPRQVGGIESEIHTTGTN